MGLPVSYALPGERGGNSMEIQAFGYLGIGASNLDDWTAFATSTIGMQSVDRARSMRAFRMDDRKQRLFVDRTLELGTQIFGWEVANGAALDSPAARLEAAGVAVNREPAALADRRCVTGLISFADPAGNRLEAFHGAQVADTVFKNPAARSPASAPARKAWAIPFSLFLTSTPPWVSTRICWASGS